MIGSALARKVLCRKYAPKGAGLGGVGDIFFRVRRGCVYVEAAPHEAAVINAISVDLEEYFHPSELPSSRDPKRWESLPARVPQQTARILDLLERRQTKATFFVLGWVAEHHPAVVRRIAEAGHEIGCHSYAHQLIYSLSRDAFRRDTLRALHAIEDACGVNATIYRAPSYSMTAESLWALEILVECGFTHDSSIYPISHDRCGIPGFGRHPQTVKTPAGPIYEIPIATAKVFGRRVTPVGGGGYLRLLPYRYVAAGIRRINGKESQPACIYFHPWELDPEQPYLADGIVARLRTYAGMSRMEAKVDRLLREFRFAGLLSVYGARTASAAKATL
jgi:polysaccharide deacetylase family protein (PEP-CTERM system associated)